MERVLKEQENGKWKKFVMLTMAHRKKSFRTSVHMERTPTTYRRYNNFCYRFLHHADIKVKWIQANMYPNENKYIFNQQTIFNIVYVCDASVENCATLSKSKGWWLSPRKKRKKWNRNKKRRREQLKQQQQQKTFCRRLHTSVLRTTGEYNANQKFDEMLHRFRV